MLFPQLHELQFFSISSSEHKIRNIFTLKAECMFQSSVVLLFWLNDPQLTFLFSSFQASMCISHFAPKQNSIICLLYDSMKILLPSHCSLRASFVSDSSSHSSFLPSSLVSQSTLFLMPSPLFPPVPKEETVFKYAEIQFMAECCII